MKTVVVDEDLTISTGAEGTVVKSGLLGTPKRVRFVLHNDAGQREVTVDVRHGDVA